MENQVNDGGRVETNAISDAVGKESENVSAPETAPETASGAKKTVKPETPPIKDDKMRRKSAIEAMNGNVKVCVKLTIFTNKALLIVDGKVYASCKLGNPFSAQAKATAVVNGVEYIYEYSSKSHIVDHILYADGILIAHKQHYMTY